MARSTSGALTLGEVRQLARVGKRASIPAVVNAASASHPELIYRLLDESVWRAAERAGAFHGSEHDLRDGFIHFSTAAQVAETAARHYAGARGLVLLSVRASALGDALRWEPSRGGALFPHLYAPLLASAVEQVAPLPLAADGRHVFPATLR
jgi:uncharacterized protein (DUF952 family)